MTAPEPSAPEQDDDDDDDDVDDNNNDLKLQVQWASYPGHNVVQQQQQLQQQQVYPNVAAAAAAAAVQVQMPSMSNNNNNNNGGAGAVAVSDADFQAYQQAFFIQCVVQSVRRSGSLLSIVMCSASWRQLCAQLVLCYVTYTQVVFWYFAIAVQQWHWRSGETPPADVTHHPLAFCIVLLLMHVFVHGFTSLVHAIPHMRCLSRSVRCNRCMYFLFIIGMLAYCASTMLVTLSAVECSNGYVRSVWVDARWIMAADVVTVAPVFATWQRVTAHCKARRQRRVPRTPARMHAIDV
jgi:hypothetical protein